MEEMKGEIGSVSWIILAVILLILSPVVKGEEPKDKPADVVEVNGNVKFNCIPVNFHPGMVVCIFQIDIKDLGKTFQTIPKVLNGASDAKENW